MRDDRADRPVDDVQWRAVESLFHAALAVEPERRSEFLDSACPGDAGLRREVASLLGFAQEPAAQPAALEQGSLLGARFLIVRQIGAGGMGEVYEATDFELGDQVALKVISPEVLNKPETLARFRREVQSAKKIAHPNICRVHDLHLHQQGAGRGREVVFLTMELLRGETLQARLLQGPLPQDEARDVAQQLAGALDAAHKAGVIHCDFKSENVMLSPLPDGSTRAVVMDFGLARSITAEGSTATITSFGQVIGTPAYLAPEQLMGERVTAAADIYALGVTLYEMVTGALPFSEVAQRLAEPAPAPSSRAPGLPRQWDTAILGCLEYYPARRFGSALDVMKVISGEADVRDRAPRRIPLAAPLALAGALVVLTSGLLWRLRVTHAVAAHIGGASIANIGGASIAILPLKTAGEGNALRYQTEGIADEITARLFQLPNLHLASRTAVDSVRDQPPAKAARTLGVTMLVTGSLESAGENGEVRAVVSLEDVPSQRVLWTDRFSGSTLDLLTLEDQISVRLIRALDISPKGDEVARVAAHPTENGEAYDSYLKGRSMVRNRRDEATVKRAMDLYSSAIARDPRFGLAYASLADASTYMYDLKKDGFWLEKALNEAGEAVRWSPYAPESHTALGSAYRATGRTKEAIAELKKALELAPGSDEANRRLASAFKDAGNTDEALRYYHKAIEANPYYWGNYAQLGVAYLHLGRYDDALGSFRKVTEIAPDLPTGYSNMAATYMYQGQYRKAIEPLTLAIQLKPTVLAYSNLSMCYSRLGDSASAIESGEHAVALDPANDIAAGNLADAYRQSGQNDKAAAGFQRAIQLAYAALQTNPRKADVMGRLAVYYAKAHQFDSAQQFIERARRVDPSDAELLFDAGLVDAIRGDQSASLRSLGLALQKGLAAAQIESAPELSDLRQTRAYREFSSALRARRN